MKKILLLSSLLFFTSCAGNTPNTERLEDQTQQSLITPSTSSGYVLHGSGAFLDSNEEIIKVKFN